MRLIDADELTLYDMRFVDGKMICDAPTIHAVPIEVLHEIRQEIKEPLYKTINPPYTKTEKAQRIALNWCLAIIDKHLEQYKEDKECIEK